MGEGVAGVTGVQELQNGSVPGPLVGLSIQAHVCMNVQGPLADHVCLRTGSSTQVVSRESGSQKHPLHAVFS